MKEVGINELALAQEQLGRMRGMTRYYHQRFFGDTRATAGAILLLFLVGFWAVPEAFLLIPIVALIGANQTAFDASYLYMARHYSASLEDEINRAMRRSVLVGAKLEDSYLFPLDDRKIVAIGWGRGFSWFGWMTLFYTLLGATAFVFGLALGWPALTAAGGVWATVYLTVLLAITSGSLVAGWWWFVRGEGERRLRAVLDSEFGQRTPPSKVTPLSG